VIPCNVILIAKALNDGNGCNERRKRDALLLLYDVDGCGARYAPGRFLCRDQKIRVRSSSFTLALSVAPCFACLSVTMTRRRNKLGSGDSSDDADVEGTSGGGAPSPSTNDSVVESLHRLGQPLPKLVAFDLE
jgi:hypothetical protein